MVVKSDAPKRARGRPAKTGETPPIKKVAAPSPKKEEASTNGDASKKKRGRPSKGNTPNEQVNGISKPKVNLEKIRMIILIQMLYFRFNQLQLRFNKNQKMLMKQQRKNVVDHHQVYRQKNL